MNFFNLVNAPPKLPPRGLSILSKIRNISQPKPLIVCAKLIFIPKIQKCVIIDLENVGVERASKLTSSFDFCIIVSKHDRVKRDNKIPKKILCKNTSHIKITIPKGLNHDQRATDDLYLVKLHNILSLTFNVTIYSDDKFRGLYEQSKVAKEGLLKHATIRGDKFYKSEEKFIPSSLTEIMIKKFKKNCKQVPKKISTSTPITPPVTSTPSPVVLSTKLCQVHGKHRSIGNLEYRTCNGGVWACRTTNQCKLSK